MERKKNHLLLLNTHTQQRSNTRVRNSTTHTQQGFTFVEIKF